MPRVSVKNATTYRSGKRSYKKKTAPYSWMKKVNPIVKKVSGLIKNVAYLKSIINSELKESINQAGSTPIRLGQFDGATTAGLNTQELTPQPSQGSSSSQRNGDSIKLHSLNIDYRFYGMTGTSAMNQIRIVIIHSYDEDETTANIATQMFLADNWTDANIRSFNSEYNHDYEKTYKLLYDKVHYLPPTQGAAATNNQSIINPSIMLNFKDHHIRFDTDSTTPVSGRIIQIVFAAVGNANATTAVTSTGAPITSVNTGVFMAYKSTAKFYDN